jgi:hypothetical protein
MLQEFGWEVFEHPAYSPDLAPSDFHLFPKLKEFLGGKRMETDWRPSSMTRGSSSCSHDWTSASICIVTTLKSRLM